MAFSSCGLLTSDFSRFPRLTVINPLVGVGCCRAVVAIAKIVVSDLGASAFGIHCVKRSSWYRVK